MATVPGARMSPQVSSRACLLPVSVLGQGQAVEAWPLSIFDCPRCLKTVVQTYLSNRTGPL